MSLDVEDEVSLDALGGFIPVELELELDDGVLDMSLDELGEAESDGLVLEAAELDGVELDEAELEGALASAVRHDENSVRDTAPSPSLSAVAKLESRLGCEAASVAVTLPSESLSSCSNVALLAGSPANAANATDVAARPERTAEIFMVGTPFRAGEPGCPWLPARRGEKLTVAARGSNVRTWRQARPGGGQAGSSRSAPPLGAGREDVPLHAGVSRTFARDHDDARAPSLRRRHVAVVVRLRRLARAADASGALGHGANVASEPHWYCVHRTAIGPLVLAAHAGGLTHVLFAKGPRAAAPDPAWELAPRRLASAVVQLDEYFAGTRRVFDLPLAPGGTPFQRRVWAALAAIPYGETVSYGELAQRLGMPGGSRAVGLANGANPLPVVVPCHRVIGADGSLTGFGGGLDLKRRLLELEGAACVRSHQASLF